MITYKHLSSPFQIGKVTIKNRFVMAPMDTGMKIELVTTHKD